MGLLALRKGGIINFLVTGRPGAGKTTLVLRVAERIAAEGFKVAGVVTEEIRKEGRRLGFEVRDFEGNREILAHVDYRGMPRVGKYGVDIEALERVVSRAMERGIPDARLVVVDEIGKMELMSPLFRRFILEMMDSRLPLLATVHQGKDPFVEAVLARDDVLLHRLSGAERGRLEEVIYGELKNVLS